jgi:hypothetical protein
VGAYLLGTSLPTDTDGGSPFVDLPLCESADDIGCVVSYASYSASEPPGDDALFGRTDQGPAVCTNPASLEGGSGDLSPYFTAAEGANLAPGIAVATPWVSVRGALTAECVETNGRQYLQVTLGGDPTDVRDRELRGGLPPTWGLHLVAANVAMGNLESLAASQAAAYAAS